MERFPKSVDLLDRSFKTITYASRVRLRHEVAPKKYVFLVNVSILIVSLLKVSSQIFLATKSFLPINFFCHKTFPVAKRLLLQNVSLHLTFNRFSNYLYLFYKRFIWSEHPLERKYFVNKRIVETFVVGNVFRHALKGSVEVILLDPPWVV